jgi:ribonuclease-3
MGDLERRVGYAFRDPAIERQVFTHSSYRHENPGEPGLDNERLEFLGDSILGFLVSRALYERFPERSEGELTRRRAHLVSAHHLARKARALELGQELYLGRGEEKGGGRDKESILADAYESLIAGIFLDGGMDAAAAFVAREFAAEVQEPLEQAPPVDYKSRLQERLHATLGPEPSYRVVEEAGPDHAKVFEVRVLVGEREVGRGLGASKKAAQQAAARAALEALEL